MPAGTPPLQAGLIVTAEDSKGQKDNKIIGITIVNEVTNTSEANSIFTYKVRNRLNGQTLVLRYQQGTGGAQGSMQSRAAAAAQAVECSPYLEILRPDGTSFLKQKLPITEILSEIEIRDALAGEWTYRVTNECVDNKNFNLSTSSSGTALLSGMVVDAATGEGVNGVAVTTDGGGVCSADESGFYTMIHPAGVFTVEATEETHGTAVKTVTLDAGEMVEVNLALGADSGDGGCGATQALGNDKQKLNLLRAFRDSVLMKSDAGAQYVSLYYKHSPEVVVLLKNDAKLAEEVKGCIISALPMLTAMMAQGANANVTDAQLKELTACLEKIKAQGSAALQKDLAGLIKQIGDRSVLQKLNK